MRTRNPGTAIPCSQAIPPLADGCNQLLLLISHSHEHDNPMRWLESARDTSRSRGGKFAMPLIGRSVSVVLKMALVLWGIISVLLGAAQSVGLDPDAPHSNWAGPFVLLSYYSVLVIGMFGLLWSRIVSGLLGLSALCAVAILVLAQPGANGLGLGLSLPSAMAVILRGPVLAGLILFFISRSERIQRTSNSA
jgi:hypothetical protein